MDADGDPRRASTCRNPTHRRTILVQDCACATEAYPAAWPKWAFELPKSRTKAKVICGAANNQLATDEVRIEVEKRGILHAPDYAVNACGLMNVSIGFDGYNRERAMPMMRTIYYKFGKIFHIAKRDGIPTLGGNSYINEYPTGRILRDAKLYAIGAGTNEIRRMLIGRELFQDLA